MQFSPRQIGYMVVVFLALMIFFTFKPFKIINPGNVGVVVVLGKTNVQALNSGFNFVNPIANVYEVSTQIQKAEAEGNAASSDLQLVDTKLTLNYHLSPDGVVGLYNSVGLNFESKIISSAIQESFKATSALYTAEALIGKREDVRTKIRESISNKLKTLTNGAIIVDDIFITNFAFSKEFEKAIENKTTQEQNALAEKNNLAKIQFIAQQAVATAQGEAQAMAAKRVQATPEFIELKKLEVQQAAISKWDGKLPDQMLGNAVPFLNVGK
jgi:regulator of protease activity HflC (stomatin/prohibitin superfamily)